MTKMADEKREGEGSQEALSAAAGGAGGAVIGALLGPVGGPIGAAVGTVVGTLGGAAGGYAGTYDTHEPAFREHHASGPARHPFEQASPAYRYGWESHGRQEYQGQSYDQARSDLHKGWAGQGDYSEFEPYVKDAWERRAAHASQAGSRPA